MRVSDVSSILLVLGCSGWLAACGTAPPAAGAPCADDTDCESGQVCAGGICETLGVIADPDAAGDTTIADPDLGGGDAARDTSSDAADGTDPDATDPDAGSDATDPDATDPDATDPDAGSDATDPDATDPDATDPDAADPDAADPDATDPDATDPDATDPDAGPVLNACGGTAVLPAAPGAGCGDCGGGTWTCDGLDAVACRDDGGLNPCGGCGALDGTPGEACGACSDGAWACDGALAVECVGAGALNACGGCAELGATPGAACGVCGGGVVTCSDDGEAVSCVGANPLNACGGCGTLSGAPGDACGTCGGGELVCNGARTALECRRASAGVNACGGCGTLAGVPGAACGDCGGAWECSTDGAGVTCVDAGAVNACGGCDPDVDALLGRACGDCGSYVCAADGGAACDDPGANACGGCGTLTPALASACGTCGLDSVVCGSAAGATTCDGDTRANACGGCTTLAATPGAFCTSGSCAGGFGRVTCDGAEAVACDCNGQACGNGVLEGFEECDDGNDDNSDLCDNNCRIDFPRDPEDLPGTCAAPIDLPIDSTFEWDLCGAGDDLDNIAGPSDCTDATSRGEDLVFRFTLSARSAIQFEVTDADPTVAIDPVVYLRSVCGDASSQLACDDDVACDAADPGLSGCSGGVQVRQGRLETVLEAGTYFAVVDQYSYSAGGTSFGCGVVRFEITVPGSLP